MLVHNVSHTDLILSLDAPKVIQPFSSTDTTLMSVVQQEREEDNDSYCLCRPRFSAFDGYSQRIVDYLEQQKQQVTSSASQSDNIIRFPRYERSDDTAGYQIKADPSNQHDKIPIGFELTFDAGSDTLRVSSSELNDLRIRGRDAPRIQSYQAISESALNINAVFFPLLANLMPLWQTKMKEKYAFLDSQNQKQNIRPSVKQVLIVVSGVGTPRNWTHSVNGNSTYQCATLMKMFLQTLYPELVVVHVHSNSRDIFRYDENIAFVQQELIPRIQEYRDAHAKGLPYPDEVPRQEPRGSDELFLNDNLPFSTEWRKSFSVTLSFADGSPGMLLVQSVI
jgi:hypothetical protein